MHGELLKARCVACATVMPWRKDLSVGEQCPMCAHSGVLRPEVVWFGEMPMHMDAIYTALSKADLFVALGTSGSVYPPQPGSSLRPAQQASGPARSIWSRPTTRGCSMRRVKPLQHRPWLGALFVSGLLRARGKARHHLPCLNVALRQLPHDRRRGRDQLTRLDGMSVVLTGWSALTLARMS